MKRYHQLAKLRELIPVWPKHSHAAHTFTEVSFLWSSARLAAEGGPPTSCRLVTETIEFFREEVFPEHSTLQPSQGDQWRNCPSSVRSVTEQDFRLPQFRDANPADYEFDKGVPVRKDRFAKGFEKLYDLLELKGDLRDVKTVCSRVADLISTEQLFSDINRMIRVSKTEELLPEIKKMAILRNCLINNVSYPIEDIEPFVAMSNTSLLNGWELSDFTSRNWTVAQMAEGGHAIFKKYPTAPSPMPGLPPIRATAPAAPMAVPFHTDREK